MPPEMDVQDDPVTTTETDAPETPPEATGSDDPAALRAELARVQKALKDANKEAAARRTRLNELEASDAERRRAQQTDAERLASELETLKQEREALASELRQRRVLDAASVEASKLGLAFHAGALADAMQLGLLAVEESEGGKLTGLPAALRALAAERPHYLKAPPSGETDATKRGNGKAGPDTESLRRRFGI